MLTLRKKHPALSKGELIHFPPENDVYVYFKILDNEMILNIVNASEEDVEIDVSKYSNIIVGRIELLNLCNNEKYNLDESSILTIPSNKAAMFLVE